MKYILITTFLTMFIYGGEINEKKIDNNWCIDSDEVIEWTLVDRQGKLYVFTDMELKAVSNADYALIVENLRVKKVIFRDVE